MPPARSAAGSTRTTAPSSPPSWSLAREEIFESHGLQRLAGDLRRTRYSFQGRNDDHVDHFAAVSRRYPRLAFVLVVSDPHASDNGSYLLLKGRRRRWIMPEQAQDDLFAAHLRKWDLLPEGARFDFSAIDLNDDTVSMAYWDAMFEEMDIAQAHWDDEVLRWLKALPPEPSRPRGIPTRRR